MDHAALPEAAGEAVPGQAAGQIGQDAGRAGRLGVAVATLGTGGRADYHRPGRICKETLSGATESATVADGKTADRGMTRRCISQTCHRPGVRADGTGDRAGQMRTA